MEHRKKKKTGIIVPIIIGLFLGVFSKMADMGSYGHVIGLLYAFGLVTSGFTPWILIAAILAIRSRSDIMAALRVGIFLLAMMVGYYVYSFFGVGYLSLRVVKFWLVMLIPSTALGYFCRRIRENKFLRILAIVGAGMLTIYSVVRIEGLQVKCMIIEAVLFLILVIAWFSRKFDLKEKQL